MGSEGGQTLKYFQRIAMFACRLQTRKFHVKVNLQIEQLPPKQPHFH
jgi:hypothetical protein